MKPAATGSASPASLSPRPLTWECDAMRSVLVVDLTSSIFILCGLFRPRTYPRQKYRQRRNGQRQHRLPMHPRRAPRQQPASQNTRLPTYVSALPQFACVLSKGGRHALRWRARSARCKRRHGLGGLRWPGPALASPHTPAVALLRFNAPNLRPRNRLCSRGCRGPLFQATEQLPTTRLSRP